MLSVNMLNALMLRVIMLSVLMLSVIMLSVIMLSVIILNVVCLKVRAPFVLPKKIRLSFNSVLPKKKKTKSKQKSLGPENQLLLKGTWLKVSIQRPAFTKRYLAARYNMIIDLY